MPWQDRALAEHVLRVHSEGKGPSRSEDGRELLSPEVLRGYIARAKEIHPFVPEELTGGFEVAAGEIEVSGIKGSWLAGFMHDPMSGIDLHSSQAICDDVWRTSGCAGTALLVEGCWQVQITEPRYTWHCWRRVHC